MSVLMPLRLMFIVPSTGFCVIIWSEYGMRTVLKPELLMRSRMAL